MQTETVTQPEAKRSVCYIVGLTGVVLSVFFGAIGFASLGSYDDAETWGAIYVSAAAFLPSLLCLLTGCIIEELRRNNAPRDKAP